MKDSDGFSQRNITFSWIFKILVLEDFLELETRIEIGIMSRGVLLISGVSTDVGNRVGWTGLTDIGVIDRLGGEPLLYDPDTMS